MSDTEHTKRFLEQLRTDDWQPAFRTLRDGAANSQLLIDAFNDPAYKNQQSMLVQLIGLHAGSESLPTMRTALLSNDDEIWSAAISVLRMWENEESKKLLEEMHSNPDITGETREAFQGALDIYESIARESKRPAKGKMYDLYLILNSGSLAKLGFEARDQVEDPIDNALYEADLGNIVGGGGGMDKCHIEFEVTDKGKARELIERELHKLKIPTSSYRFIRVHPMMAFLFPSLFIKYWFK